MAENPSGVAFPFRFNAAGSTQLSSGSLKVRDNLAALAKTAINERLIRKGVGTVGFEAVLRNADPGVLAAIKGLVLEAYAKYERRALVLKLDIFRQETESGAAIILDVDFLFRDTGTQESLVTQL